MHGAFGSYCSNIAHCGLNFNSGLCLPRVYLSNDTEKVGRDGSSAQGVELQELLPVAAVPVGGQLGIETGADGDRRRLKTFAFMVPGSAGSRQAEIYWGESGRKPRISWLQIQRLTGTLYFTSTDDAT